MMFAAIAAVLVSCQSKSNPDSNTLDEGIIEVVESAAPSAIVYEGILPAADGPGIQYILSMDNVPNNEEGDYTLTTTYLEAENGLDKSFISHGKRHMLQKQVNDQLKSAYQLVPENGEPALYLTIVNDSTLRFVSEDLQEIVSGLNYDIIQVKK